MIKPTTSATNAIWSETEDANSCETVSNSPAENSLSSSTISPIH